MNLLYICKVSAYQAAGNQIDIPRKIAKEFFGVTDSMINGAQNMDINVCHISHLTDFFTLEIQSATNPRFSSKLNSFLASNGDALSDGDLLVIEKIERSYCVWLIKQDNTKYAPLIELFEQNERHVLLTGYLDTQPSATTISLQTIFYGAPGTGKSHEIQQRTKNAEVIRTTFHPDSDYASFVGAYKPIEKEVDVIATPIITKQGISLGTPGTYSEKRITYEFVKQAFLKAYLMAWKQYTNIADPIQFTTKHNTSYAIIEVSNDRAKTEKKEVLSKERMLKAWKNSWKNGDFQIPKSSGDHIAFKACDIIHDQNPTPLKDEDAWSFLINAVKEGGITKIKSDYNIPLF